MINLEVLQHPFLLLLIPVVAFLYASVGHGGASGYLGLMAIFCIPISIAKPSALLLNIFIAGISFVQFYKNKHFKWNIFFPFAIASVPFAFVGGFIQIDVRMYKIMLSCVLLLAIIRMMSDKQFAQHQVKQQSFVLSLFVGACIGFISGLLGIGGGILLSPFLLMMGWTNLKQAAAVASLFIFVNSSAGLLGHLSSGLNLDYSVWPLLVLAAFGGVLGSYYGSTKFNNKSMKYVLASVLLLAILKLSFT